VIQYRKLLVFSSDYCSENTIEQEKAREPLEQNGNRSLRAACHRFSIVAFEGEDFILFAVPSLVTY
jgi:hypothetical protein